MCCCYCKSRFSKFPLISGVTKTLSNMVKKFEVNRTISKFSIICSLETFINQRDQTFLARSIRARITREKFLHVQKNVNIHTVKSVKSIRNILCLRQNDNETICYCAREIVISDGNNNFSIIQPFCFLFWP